MSTKYWMAALLIVVLAAPALLSGGIQTAQAGCPTDETAQFTAEDANGWTALHYAAALNLTSLAECLLESGAKVNARLRVDGEPFTDKLKATLRRFGKYYGDRNRDGETPLHIAAKENAYETAILLLEKGAKVDAETYDKEWTPLHFAAKENARETAELLLEKGAAVNAKTDDDDDEMTPLHFAARENARAVAKLLLDKGADVNARDEDERTPLHIAARYDAYNVAELLLDKGADVNARDEDGDTPLDFAVDETAALLRSHGGRRRR